jgi:hypothetical protein
MSSGKCFNIPAGVRFHTKHKTKDRNITVQRMQQERVEYPNRWLKRLLVMHRSPAGLALSQSKRACRTKGSFAKFIGCRKSSTGETFALYSIPVSGKALSREAARFFAMSSWKRPIEKRSLGNWPVLYSSPAGNRSHSAHFDNKCGNKEPKTN